MIPLFGEYDSPKNSQGVTPARAICESGVGSNERFLQFFDLSRLISETVQDTTEVTIER